MSYDSLRGFFSIRGSFLVIGVAVVATTLLFFHASALAQQDDSSSDDATLSGLQLSGTDFGIFDSATTSYSASVANSVAQTTVTPTVSDSGASYVIKLGGVTDEDGVIALSEGENVITVRVTAEDGTTTNIYTVTVTRALPPPDPTAGICGRTQQVRDSIVSNVRGVDDCSAITSSHLSAIRGLNLRSKGITAVKSGDFHGLSGMTILWLDRNSLSALPSDIFEGLSSLESLYLGFNDIDSLHTGVFDGLSSLEFLTVSNNELSSLPSDVFGGLSKLERLNLGDNKLSSLPSDVFDGVPNLKLLSLNDNKLSTLPNGVFGDLTDLEDLYINQNRLSAIPGGIFNDLSSLHVLFAFENNISSLSSGSFLGLSSLRTLNIEDNPGAPFVLTADLERRGSDSVVVKVDEAVPFGTNITLSAQNGTLSSSTLNIAGGSTTSGAMTVTPEQTDARVTVSVNAVSFTGSPYHSGIQTNMGDSLELVFGTPPLDPISVPTVEVSFGAAAYRVAEGASGTTVVVTLDDDPARTVVVSITTTNENGASGADYSGVPNNITFNSGETSKSFTFIATDDSTIDGGESVKLGFGTLPAGVTEGTPNETTISITDNDVAGVTVDPTTVTVTEGGTATYSMKLNTQPAGTVTITIVDPNDSTNVTADPASLTFDSSSWNTAQNVTVSAGQDSDTSDDRATITHTVSGYGTVTSADSVTVMVTDDDPPSTTTPDPDPVEGICDRTEQVRDAILAKLPRLNGDCSAVSAFDLRGVTGYMAISDLTSLREGDLQGLTELKQLYLGDNSLSSLPNGIFDDLDSLIYLDLKSNDLNSISVDMFEPLTSLESLILSSNRIGSLPAGVFDELTDLTNLDVDSNDIDTLPSGIFSKLTKLYRLRLSSNDISTLPSGVFDPLTSLGRLYLDSNDISTLSTETFAKLTDLEYLLLSDNNLKHSSRRSVHWLDGTPHN